MKSNDLRSKEEQKIVQKLKFLSFIPGYGQIINKQFEKAIMFVFLFLIFFIPGVINVQERGIKIFDPNGIGTAGIDNSPIVISFGLIGFALVGISFVIAIFTRNEAINSAIKIHRTGKIPTFEEQMQQILEDNSVAILSFIPLVIVVILAVVPIIYSLMLAFINYNANYKPSSEVLQWVGFENFKKIVNLPNFRQEFLNVFAWNIAWSILGTTIPLVLGFLLALILNQKNFKGAKIIRSLMLLPMAIPAFISIILFGQIFVEGDGVFDKVVVPFLNTFGLNLSGIKWKNGDGTATRVILILIQTWLAFPYFLTLFTATMQSIPANLYDAAQIDGASKSKQTFKITIPMVLIATIPALIGQFVFNFNNFLLIYLFNEGGPSYGAGSSAGKTDILISWILKNIMGSQGNQVDYSQIAVISMITAIFTITIAMFVLLRSNSFKKEEMM